MGDCAWGRGGQGGSRGKVEVGVKTECEHDA